MANNLTLYKEALKNMTPLELTLKCHSRSIDFIKEAIDFLNEGDKTNFVLSINNALKILENFMYSLQLTNSDGSINNPAHQSFMIYEFITHTLRKGMINFTIDEFEECCKFLEELYNAYRKTNIV